MAPADDFQSAFYPFLGQGQETNSDTMATLTNSIRDKAAESSDTKQAFFDAHSEDLLSAARDLATVYRNDGRLFTMGNGGSSCDAAHVAVEFTHPVTVGRPALMAIHLGADLSMITAVANDVGFREVFARQIIANARTGDAVLGISTSGNSENVLAGFAEAKRMGLLTIGLAGNDGGRMKSDAALDHCLVVGSPSIHRIQECHVAIYHILWDLVHTLLAMKDVKPSKTT